MRLMSAVRDAVGPGVAVIAAAYADAGALDPPAFAPGSLPALVERTGIAGALVDTFVKDGRGLYGWLSEPEVSRPDRSHAARGRDVCCRRATAASPSSAASTPTSSVCAPRFVATATARLISKPTWSPSALAALQDFGAEGAYMPPASPSADV